MSDRDRLDEVLAGGCLPARSYDEIFEKVLKSVRQEEKRRAGWSRWRWTLIPVGALVLVLGAGLALFQADGPGFSAKGARLQSPSTFAGRIDIACQSSSAPRCRVGETMMFAIGPSKTSGYIAAYAQRVGDPTGERIWYFPDAAEKAPFVSAGDSTRVLAEGVKVGAEHRPGKYRVTLWLAPGPIDRNSAISPTHVEVEILP